MAAVELDTVSVPPDAPPPGPSTAHNADPSRLTPWLIGILAIVIIADMLDLIDSQITNIAAPSIVHDLGGGEALIKWLGASYQMALGTFLVIGGRLGDRYGKRRLFLTGIAGFVAASTLCGLSVDPAMIIIGRIIQGAFGAMLIPQGISILMANFSREQLPRAFSTLAPIMGIAAVSGPIVGGFIISANIAGQHWRPVFLINVVLGGVGLIAALRLLPHDKPTSQERIDAVGSALLGFMMLTLIFGLIQGSTDGWTGIPIASLAAGVIFFVAFAMRQRRAANPLIKPSLFANRGFSAGLVIALAFFVAMAGLTYVLSLFFQLILHFTPAHAAIAMSPIALGFIGGSFGSYPLIQRLGRTIVAIGLAVTLCGTIGLWATVLARGIEVSAWLTAPSIFVFGLGMGACLSSLFNVALGEIAHDEAGSASGALSAVQQLATAIGSAVVTTVFFEVDAGHGGATAMTTTVFVVAVIFAACLVLVWLLPRAAAVEALPLE